MMVVIEYSVFIASAYLRGTHCKFSKHSALNEAALRDGVSPTTFRW